MTPEEAFRALEGNVIPHCDQAVLHAPGECKYCDKYPMWQALRVVWGIAFTGHVPRMDSDEMSCPSDHRRGLTGAHVWPGNVPKVEEGN